MERFLRECFFSRLLSVRVVSIDSSRAGFFQSALLPRPLPLLLRNLLSPVGPNEVVCIVQTSKTRSRNPPPLLQCQTGFLFPIKVVTVLVIWRQGTIWWLFSHLKDLATILLSRASKAPLFRAVVHFLATYTCTEQGTVNSQKTLRSKLSP